MSVEKLGVPYHVQIWYFQKKIDLCAPIKYKIGLSKVEVLKSYRIFVIQNNYGVGDFCSPAKIGLTTVHICNLGHNILELYNVLIQTGLTTSKKTRDIWYRKLGIRVISRVAERLKS